MAEKLFNKFSTKTGQGIVHRSLLILQFVIFVELHFFNDKSKMTNER